MSLYSTAAIATILRNNDPGSNYLSILEAAQAKPIWPDPKVFQNLYTAYSRYIRRLYAKLPHVKARTVEASTRRAFLVEYAKAVCHKARLHSQLFDKLEQDFKIRSTFSRDDILTWQQDLTAGDVNHLLFLIETTRRRLDSDVQWVPEHQSQRPTGADQLQAWRRTAFDPKHNMRMPSDGHVDWTKASYVHSTLHRRAQQNVQRVGSPNQDYALHLARQYLLERHVREVCSCAHTKPSVQLTLRLIEGYLDGTRQPPRGLHLYGWFENEQQHLALLARVRQAIAQIPA